MVRIWSEPPDARLTEQAADLMSGGFIAWQVYQLIEAFAEAGRLIRAGGDTMTQSGRDLGAALSGVALVGEGL